jgi:hypothetical protein
MNTGTFLAMAVVVLASACGKTDGDPAPPVASGGDAPSGAAMSGEPSDGGSLATPHGGSTGTGGAPRDCAGLPLACCVPDVPPCSGLNEADCKTLAACIPFYGARWKIGDDPFIRGRPMIYLSCESVCEEHCCEDTPFCVFEPSEPTACFVVRSEGNVPGDWSKFIECESIPEGACVE